MQKLRFYTNMKDRIPKLMISYVVYQFSCPGSNDSYNGKTERNLCTRTEEHACSDKGGTIYDHIKNCSYYSNIIKIFSDSVIFHLIKHCLVTTQTKVTPK